MWFGMVVYKYADVFKPNNCQAFACCWSATALSSGQPAGTVEIGVMLRISRKLPCHVNRRYGSYWLAETLFTLDTYFLVFCQMHSKTKFLLSPTLLLFHQSKSILRTEMNTLLSQIDSRTHKGIITSLIQLF